MADPNVAQRSCNMVFTLRPSAHLGLCSGMLYRHTAVVCSTRPLVEESPLVNLNCIPTAVS